MHKICMYRAFPEPADSKPISFLLLNFQIGYVIIFLTDTAMLVFNNFAKM